MSKKLLNVIISLFSTFCLTIQSAQTMEQNLNDFSKLHEKGITGKGTKVCVIEKGCCTDHPAFQEVNDQLKFIDVGHTSKPIDGFQDCSRRRYPEANDKDSVILTGKNDLRTEHGTHVGALIVSKPQKYEGSPFFPGGAAPDALMILIATSNVRLHECWQKPGFTHFGTALYSFKDADDRESDTSKLKKDFYFNPLRSSSYYEERMDESLIDAFDQAFGSGAKVLNFSMELVSIVDPFNEYRIPEVLLQKITNRLVNNDQILILSANNQFHDLSEYKEQVYFQQFSNISDIASRMLIVVNVYNDESGNTVKLCPFSNWPGKLLKDYTVSAFGTDVVSGWSKVGEVFSAKSGTSQAAPKVSGFCLLIEQFHKDKGKLITASEIVDFVKRTAKPIGDSEKFGKGLIDPDALLCHTNSQ